MDVNLELQLMQDLGTGMWLPRSRPTVATIEIGGNRQQPVKLTPGAGAVGTEQMLIWLDDVTRSEMTWAVARVGLTIEGIHIGASRPGTFWLGHFDQPTGVVHYPVVAGNENMMFRGRHSLLMRVVP